MTEPNPGPGWREVDDLVPGSHPTFVLYPNDGTDARYWIPEVPLPAEIYTVIRVPSPVRDDGVLLVRVESGQWVDVAAGEAVDPLSITDFEVLARPLGISAWDSVMARQLEEIRNAVRCGTAKAVGDEIRKVSSRGDGWDHSLTESQLASVLEAFGVEPKAPSVRFPPYMEV